MSEQSETIGKLAEALAKAQGSMGGAKKDSENPFFKSAYADLASVWDACRKSLSENGLSVIQTTDLQEAGVTVITTLAHSSGEWMRGRLRMMPTKADPQGIGSCISYARRYALAAMVGVYQIDDDANTASGKVTDGRPEGWNRQDTKKVTEVVTRILDAIRDDKDAASIWNEVKDDHEFATAVWTKLPKPVRDSIRNEVKAA